MRETKRGRTERTKSFSKTTASLQFKSRNPHKQTHRTVFPNTNPATFFADVMRRHYPQGNQYVMEEGAMGK